MLDKRVEKLLETGLSSNVRPGADDKNNQGQRLAGARCWMECRPRCRQLDAMAFTRLALQRPSHVCKKRQALAKAKALCEACSGSA